MHPFDPAAATAAYLAALTPAQHARAQAYTQGGHWLLLWGWVVTVAAAVIILKAGPLRALRDRLGGWPKATAFLAAMLFVLIDFVIELPWSSYANWARERSYGLSSQSWPGWLADQLKSVAISAVVMGLLALCIYTLMRRCPRSWWAWSAAVLAGFFAVGLLLAPVLIEPLFNTYTPAPAGPVRDQVVAMANRVGVPSDKIFVYDGSRQSDRYTANVSGIGGSARVAMSDTMFRQGANLAEVRGVVGHEMGHYVLHHSLRIAAVFSLIGLLVLGLVHLLFAPVSRLLRESGRIVSIADPAGLPIVMLIFATLMLLLTPAIATLSRTVETEADIFSVEHFHEPDGMAKALVKTIAYRAATPGPVEEFLFYDHPSVGARVRRMMAWKAAHPDRVGAPPSP